MATLLDAPKPTTAKYEEVVEKQIAEAGRRIRLVDAYGVGILLFCVFLAFTLTALLIDRYVQTRPGTGWAALAAFLLLAGAYAWLKLFRGGRRSINPYFAARSVEATIPDAKNSLINWIDLKEDAKIPESLRAAMGARAAKDLRHADMTRVPEGKSFTWQLIAAGALGIGCLVVAFLPPTRTEVQIVLPKDGDATVFSGEDLRFEAKLLGRIPKANDADRARLRVWYNPEDETTYDDFPLEVSAEDRRAWSAVIKANHVRKGFDYQFLAGDGASPRHHVTCKVIPILTGFDVTYKLPTYLNKPDEKANDPNLFNYYGTEATIVAQTNRDAAKGYIQIEGSPRSYDAVVPADRPDTLRFKIPLEKEGQYRIFFTTTEGDRNSDPQKYRIGLVDPKPLFVTYDHKFQYPDYLRWKPQTVLGGKSADIEAIRGTVPTLVAHANRPVASAQLILVGLEKPIDGEPLMDDPLAVAFKLPALEEDKAFRLVMTPRTGEGASEPQSFQIRVLRDQEPQVKITSPKDETIELPANATLEVEGLATDDHGIGRMNLRLAVIAPFSESLKEKPYRDGKEFKREKDNSFPTRLEYKDAVELQKLEFESPERKLTKIAEGMIVEYWLEAVDNCNVKPGPNRGYSKHQRVKVIAPVKEADKVKAQEQRKAEFDDKRKKFEEAQDKKNEGEERVPGQPEPKQAEGKQGERKSGEPKKGEADPDGKAGEGEGEGKPGEPGPKGGKPREGKAGEGAEPKDRATQEKADRVRDALEKDKLAAKEPGKGGKSEPEPKPEMKGEPESKTGTPKSGGPGTPGKADPKSKSKPEQGPPSDPGELSREIASNDFKMDPGQKEEMERLIRNPEKRKEMEDKIDEMKKEIKDPAKRDQFERDANQAKENAKKQDDIDELAKKSKNKDPAKAEQAKKDLDDQMKDPANRQQGEKAGEQMDKSKGSDPQAGEKCQALDDAMEKGREDNLKDAAKKMQSEDAGERADGQKKMDDLMKDPKARNQAEKMKGELAKGAGDDKQKQEDFKKELDKSADKGRQENADQIAKGAKSDKPRDQAKAEKDLENLKQNDPAGAEKAEQKMQADKPKDGKGDKAEMAKKDGAGGQEEKKDGQAGSKETAKKDGTGGNEGMEKKVGQPGGKQEQAKGGEGKDDPMGGGQGAKKQMAKGGKQGGKGGAGGESDPGELDRELQSKDQDFSGQAKQSELSQLLRDKELRKKAEQSLEEAKKNQPDPAKREEMQKNFDEAKKNADLRDKMQEDVDQLAKKKKPEEEKKDTAGKDAEPKGGEAGKDGKGAAGKADPAMAKKDGDPKGGEAGKDGKGAPGKADPTTAKKDAAGDAGDSGQQQAEKDLQDKLKDPNARAQAEKMAEDMRKKDPAGAKEMNKQLDKARENQLKDAAQKAGEAGAGKAKDQAAKGLAEAMKDPKTRQMAKEMMEKLMDQAKDPEKRKQLEEMMKQAAEQARKDNLKDLAKDAKSKDQRDVEKAARDLKDLMDKDPEAKKMMEDLAKKANDPDVKKGLEDLQRKAEELAKQAEKDGPEQIPMPKSKDDVAGKDKDGDKRAEAPKGGEAKDGMPKGEGKQDNDLAEGGGKTGNLKGENPKTFGKDGPGRLEGTVADLNNRLKAGEMQLEKFQKNAGNTDLLKKLDYTEAEYAEFLKSYEELVVKLRKQLADAEKKEPLPTPRVGSSGLNQGPESIKLEGGKDGKVERGSKAAPPPDFKDAYKRYTEQQSGAAEAKPADPKQPK